MNFRKIIVIFFSIFLIISNITAQPHELKREMRAAWISTVFNKDWPSETGLSAKQQQAELIKLLDLHKKNGMNAIIFQIRTAADALYDSPFEPWSQWLSGTQGIAPSPLYDPLRFAIAETHKRGMEFHAWLNPYRAEMDTGKQAVVADHITRQHPEWFVAYKNRRYFDPGIPEVRTYITKIVQDVVKRYDVDAIHFDDYFYPYKLRGQDFPDSLSFQKYGHAFSKEKKDDWRRNNVDLVIKMLHDSIVAVKPYVKFGISPFGIWRNKRDDPRGSNTRGMSNYNDLYADILKWLKNDWIDYVAPQIYWYIGHKLADYETLVNWWAKNSHGKHVYIGIGIYRATSDAKDRAWRDASEIPKQIDMYRNTAHIQGAAFFTSQSFVKNNLGINDSLQNRLFKYPAFIPAMPWKVLNLPEAPPDIRSVRVKNQVLLTWNPAKTDRSLPEKTAAYYVVYRFKGEEQGELKPENVYALVTDTYVLIVRRKGVWFRKKYTYVVTAFDRLHNEGKTSFLILKE